MDHYHYNLYNVLLQAPLEGHSEQPLHVLPLYSLLAPRGQAQVTIGSSQIYFKIEGEVIIHRQV